MRKIFGYVRENFCRQKDMMTPDDKLKSLPDAATCLKPDLTFKQLDAITTKQSGLDAWQHLQKARTRLFDTIFGQSPKTA